MKTTIPRPEFPRPDFERDLWEPLNGEWDFSFDQPIFDQTILVPFCYQSAMSGIHVLQDHPVVWYRRPFPVDSQKLNGRRLLLKFGAVDTFAEIWINDHLAGTHEGGNTPFQLDITELVHIGINEVTLRVTDYANPDKPRGKQSWTGEPFACWYTPVTGIWQSVWLEYVGQVYLKRIKITPDVDHLQALCEVFLSSDEEAEVVLEMYTPTGNKPLCRQWVLCHHGYGKASFTFPDLDIKRNELLWSPETPNLITVTVQVSGKQGESDHVKTYFGMRTIKCDHGTITLNGSRLYQRLVLDQGYWPDSLLTPPDDEAIRQDILLTKAMGFNGARKHQKIEDPRYYYWADRLGLLVWGELPSAYTFNDTAIRSSSEELMRFVERDYNHPCIITWVPLNESWGVREIKGNPQQQDYCRMLHYLLKALDPIRLVSSNDGWEQVSQTDLCAIHDYSLFPETTAKYDDLESLCSSVAEQRMIFAENNAYQKQPVFITEYGGIAFEENQKEKAWGYYGKVQTEKQFLDRLKPITSILIRSGKFQGFCYTQLTDVMQETNGLLTPDRQPKLSLEKLHAVFSQSHINLP